MYKNIRHASNCHHECSSNSLSERFKKRIFATLRKAILSAVVFSIPISYANPDPDGLGQTIQIKMHLRSFRGKPSWLLIIRDLDHGQNIPYLFDITDTDNVWLAFTYGRDYLITVSNLQFSPYGYNPDCLYEPYCSMKINNFCGLEDGHIMRGESIIINISGNLTPNPNTFTCHILRYPDRIFTIVRENVAP